MHKIPLNKSFFLLIFLGLGFSQLNAQDLLTLDEAINLVQENNSEIKRQKIILDASERAAKNSWNSFVPSLTLSATDTFNADKTQNQNEAAINGNVSLSLKADSFSASRKLKLDYEIEKQNYNQLCNQIEVSVWNSYLDIINLQQEIEHRNQILKNSESLVNENKLKYKKGYLSETEYLSSKITFEKQIMEINNKNQEKDFSSKFNNLKSELESKKQSIQSYKTFVEITQKNYQLCMKAYNSGRLDYQSLKNASTELLETQIEYTNCVVEIIKTYVSIKELIGGQ